MAGPGGGGDGRRPRPRPSDGAALGATRRRSVRELCGASRCGRGVGRRDCGRGRARNRGCRGRRRRGRASRTMVARAEAELGPVTILVNNAGVAWRGDAREL